MLILITVVLLTIFISANCSLYEATLYSTRIGTLESEKTEGKNPKLAQKMLDMKNAISTPLSAILILNTIANTAGATIAGMYAHQALGAHLVPVFSLGFTLAILFFAEIIPKTLGSIHWRHIWPHIVLPLSVMKTILYPFIYVSQKLTATLSRQNVSAQPITEDDILGMIRLGAKEGEISQWESQFLHNIINLEEIEVQEIMTPRTVIFSLDADMKVEEAFELANKEGFTRIPIYRNDKENIIGYVLIHELGSAKTLSNPDAPLSSIAQPIFYVSETENCLTLLTDFLKQRRHISVIGDEYGGVAGLVTLEDLIETMLGTEIVDENDSVVDLQKMARSRRTKRFSQNKPQNVS